MTSIDLARCRIAVTGGGGFLGSYVVEELRRQGCTADGVVVVRSRDYDLRDKAACRRMYDELAPDIVIHLAAVVGGIAANAANSGRFFYENLVMGAELIEEGRRYGKLTRFVATGTVCSYPKHARVPFCEDELWDGYPEETNAPYGNAKRMLLLQLRAYQTQYGFPGVFLLPVNLYGPRDNFDPATSHVIPAMIRKFDDAKMQGEKSVALWGDGTPTREFLHARDAARGIVLATERYDRTDPINLGTGREISIRDLATKIATLTGFSGEIKWQPDRPNGQPRRMLDVSRAKEAFGFQASMDFDEGLAETIAWWRERRRQELT